MAEPRRRHAQGFVEKNLLGRVGDMVVATENMGDAELGVVDDTAEIIGGRTVRFDKNLILDVFRIHLDPAVNQVVVGDFSAGNDPEEDRLPFLVGRAGRGQLFRLFPVDVERRL